MANSFLSPRCGVVADMPPTTATPLGAGVVALIIVVALIGAAAPNARRDERTPTAAAHTGAHLRATMRQRITSRRQRRHARRAAPPASAAAWCEAIARRLRAGEALRHVLTREQPVHGALRAQTEPLRRALAHGASVAEAVAAAATPQHARLDLVWAVLAVTSDYGGGAAGPIDRTAAALRLRSADAQERSAQSAQARLSAHVLTAVPLVVLALLMATDPDVRHIVVRPSGWLILGAGLVLNLCGWCWMRFIVSSRSS